VKTAYFSYFLVDFNYSFWKNRYFIGILGKNFRISGKIGINGKVGNNLEL